MECPSIHFVLLIWGDRRDAQTLVESRVVPDPAQKHSFLQVTDFLTLLNIVSFTELNLSKSHKQVTITGKQVNIPDHKFGSICLLLWKIKFL